MKVAPPGRTRLRGPAVLIVAASAAWWAGVALARGGIGRDALIALGAVGLAAPLLKWYFARASASVALAVDVPVLLMLASTMVLRVRTADALSANPLDSAGLLRVGFVGLALVLGAFALLSPPLEEATRRDRLTTRPFRVYLVYIAVVMLGIPASVKPGLTSYRLFELTAGCVVLLGAYRALGNAASRRIESTLYWFTAASVCAVWAGRFLTPGRALQRPLDAAVPLKWELVGVWPTLSANSVGALGVLLAVWSLARFMNASRWDGRRSVALALTLLGVITTIGAQYRTGYVALVAAALVIFWLRRRELVVVLAAVGLFVVLSTPSVISSAQPYVLRGQTTTQAKSLSGRTDYWSRAVEVWQESPIIGRGLWTASRYEVLAPLGLSDTAAVHSTWVEALVGTGVLGLTLLATCVLMTLGRAWQAARASPYGVIGPLAIMVALTIRSLTGNLFESSGHEQLVFLAIMLTLEDVLTRRSFRGDDSRPVAPPARSAATL